MTENPGTGTTPRESGPGGQSTRHDKHPGLSGSGCSGPEATGTSRDDGSIAPPCGGETSSSGDGTVLLQAEDLVFSYDTPEDGEGTTRLILDNVSLCLGRGESVALLGASGSGKSTLLSLLGLLNRPNSGRIFFEGRDTSLLDEPERNALRASSIGFVFQHHFLLPELTAAENVLIAGRLAEAASAVPAGPDDGSLEERVLALLDRLGLSHRKDAHPRRLSGGEQQRVAIARALINGPRLVLADEPTGNLDSGTGSRVLEVLEELRSDLGTTLLLVTHDENVASYCERKLTISDGRLLH